VKEETATLVIKKRARESITNLDAAYSAGFAAHRCESPILKVHFIYRMGLYILIDQMALSIKNSETERLARSVANQTGESLTEAIEQALRERLERLQRQRRAHLLAERLDDILARVDSLSTIDHRSADRILGYDKHGLPR
jgi:antitoxin VapB